MKLELNFCASQVFYSDLRYGECFSVPGSPNNVFMKMSPRQENEKSHFVNLGSGTHCSPYADPTNAVVIRRNLKVVEE